MTNLNKFFITGAIVLVIGILVMLVPFAIHTVTKNIVHEAKQEVVKDVKAEAKKISDIDQEKVAKALAGTIHKISTFKKEVKQELQKLDSTDNK